MIKKRKPKITVLTMSLEQAKKWLENLAKRKR